MTMRVDVTNHDQSRAARVTVRDVGVDGSRHEHVPAKVLRPGESCECWIHDRREVLVEELPDGWDAPVGEKGEP